MFHSHYAFVVMGYCIANSGSNIKWNLVANALSSIFEDESKLATFAQELKRSEKYTIEKLVISIYNDTGINISSN